MFSLLEDKSTYKVVKTNPLKKLQTKVYKLLSNDDNWNDNGISYEKIP